MNPINVGSVLWAITKAGADAVLERFIALMASPDKSWLNPQMGKPWDDLYSRQSAYGLNNGTAQIRIEGPIFRNAFNAWLFDGTSSEAIAEAVGRAVSDSAVKRIEYLINSPGGTVDGTQECAFAVASASSQKPSRSVALGMMTSAAYYIGSAAGIVALSSDNTMIGSIGVRTIHADISGLLERMGIKVTDLWSGEGKVTGSMNQPLSKEDRALIQAELDHVREVFVSDVSRFRGVSTEKISSLGAHVYTGRKAIEAGLADDLLLDKKKIKAFGQKKDAVSHAAHFEEEKRMDIEKLKAEHPAVYQQVFEAGAASVKPPDMTVAIDAAKQEAHAVGLTEGAKNERERIASVRAQSLSGHESLIDRLAMDGNTTGPEAAVAVLNAEKSIRARALEAFQSGGPPVVPHAEPPISTPSKKEQVQTLISTYARENNVDLKTATLAVSKDHPDLFRN